jgi:hypothetical protein
MSPFLVAIQKKNPYHYPLDDIYNIWNGKI